ncbi:MAG: AI-2E family transporter [Deltaproteobacteria bacterium]|nr:AI-2E family transporter [Deltaproteobacteria bacterium]
MSDGWNHVEQGGAVASKKKRAPAPPPPPLPVAAPAVPRPLLIDDRMLWTLLLLAATAGVVWLVRGVLVPLLFVAVFSFLGAPLVTRLERRMPRGVAAALVVLGVSVLGLLALSLMIPPLVSDLVALFSGLPALLREAGALIQARFGVEVPLSVADLSSEASKELIDQLLPFAKSTGAAVKTGAVGVLKGAAGAAAFAGKALLLPVLTFFALAELPRIRAVLGPLVPRGSRGLLGYYVPLIDDTLSRLVRGQLVVAGVMMALYAVGLSIAGVPLALAIAVLAGAAYLIPFASGTVCIVLSLAFSALELREQALWPCVGALIVAGVVQLVESYVLTPRIVGEQAGLSPFAAILAVLLGGTAAGFLGVVFALPTAAVLALILREEARRRGGVLVESAAEEVSA